MQETVNVVSQYYTDFVNLPIGYQVATGVAALVVISALRNIWKVTLPVRASVAGVLRSTAFLVHPRKRKVKEVEKIVEKIVKVEAPTPPKWDTSTKKAYSETALYFASEDRVSDLTDEQLEIINKVGKVYGYEKASSWQVHYASDEAEKRRIEKAASNALIDVLDPPKTPQTDEFTRRQAIQENIA